MGSMPLGAYYALNPLEGKACFAFVAIKSTFCGICGAFATVAGMATLPRCQPIRAKPAPPVAPISTTAQGATFQTVSNTKHSTPKASARRSVIATRKTGS